MNTRSLRSISVLALSVVLSSGAARAVESGSQASALARLIQPVAITTIQNIYFGTLVKGSLSGPVTVTVNPQVGNLPTISSSDSSQVQALGGQTDAGFLIAGEADRVVGVQYPSVIVMDKVGGSGSDAQKMSITNILVDVWDSQDPSLDLFNGSSFILPADGNVLLEVGGTLTVNNDDEVGEYQGTFDITVKYL